MRALDRTCVKLKSYIDQLLAVVLENNPSLLEGMPRIQQNTGMKMELFRMASLQEVSRHTQELTLSKETLAQVNKYSLQKSLLPSVVSTLVIIICVGAPLLRVYCFHNEIILLTKSGVVRDLATNPTYSSCSFWSAIPTFCFTQCHVYYWVMCAFVAV